MARAAKIENLNCVAHAAQGARLVVETRFGEMWALREAALEWSDPEGVHDMRVASRRLRSALHDFASHLPQLKLRKLQKHLRLIAAALGQVRDLDVSIAALEALRDDAPEDFKTGIEQIAEQRKLKRESFRAELHAVISLESRERSRRLFTKAMEKWPVVQTDQVRHEPNLTEVGRAVIVERAKDLRQLSTSLYQPFEIEPLHRMRIMAKRLRYAIELFAPCWPDLLSGTSNEVSRLQAELGDVHDCDEWIAGFGRELRRRQDFSDAWCQAAQWLLANFVKKRGKSYASSLMIWQQWEKENFFENLGAMLFADSSAPASVAANEGN